MKHIEGICKKYQAIFDYFDGYLLGLTATPRSDIDKNTYKIFELQDNVPTYSYEYEEAVEAGFLVDYHTIECSTGFIREGIKYNDLSEEDKEEFEDTFADDEDVTDTIAPGAMFSWLFNENTIDQILGLLMEKGLKVESNDKLGKTIIFAKNHKHAVAIEERFNLLYPQYHGEFARVIDNHVNYASSLIEDFSDVNKMPQIAISVDMMDTEIDVPEVVNLVFFKEVKSKVKFLQMIGRGTRLCPDLFGWGKDKKEFYIFDACQNFEFFEQNPKGKESTLGMSLSQFIFELKVDILRELEKLECLNDDDYINYKNLLLEELVDVVNSFNTLKFDVKQRIKYVEKYKDVVNWNNLTDLQVKEIKDNLTSLIMSNDSDESAKQFDRLMLAIELSKMLNIKYNRETNRLEHIGEGLLGLMNIPQVQAKNNDVKKIIETTYVERADIFEIDRIRDSLRELIKYLPKRIKKDVYTNFSVKVNIKMYKKLKIKMYKKCNIKMHNIVHFYFIINRHLQEYLDWFVFVFTMKKKFSLNKIKTESYNRIVLDNNYIKANDIVKLDIPINLDIAYAEYNYQS